MREVTKNSDNKKREIFLMDILSSSEFHTGAVRTAKACFSAVDDVRRC